MQIDDFIYQLIISTNQQEKETRICKLMILIDSNFRLAWKEADEGIGKEHAG